MDSLDHQDFPHSTHKDSLPSSLLPFAPLDACRSFLASLKTGSLAPRFFFHGLTIGLLVRFTHVPHARVSTHLSLPLVWTPR